MINKLFIPLIVCVVFLASCKKSPPPVENREFTQLSGNSIIAKLNENFVIADGCSFISDDYKTLVDQEWIEKVFIPAFWDAKQKDGISYRSERADCDDFALFALNVARKLPVGKYSPSIGLYSFIRDDGQSHAINIFLLRDGENIKIVYFEPQADKIVTLTETERNNCKFYYF